MSKHSTKELIGKMRDCVEQIEKGLRSNLSAEVQISDVNTWCWAMVQLCQILQDQVRDELSDIE
jgi:hypothetical protein